MKKLILSIVIAAMTLATNSCKKDENNSKSSNTSEYVPVLTTKSVTNISPNTANCGGIITSDKGNSISKKGVCWSTHENPTISDSISTDGNGASDYNSSLTNLIPGTNYYVRAYATNSKGTGYGSALTFKTTAMPVVQTVTINNILSTQAQSGGIITSDGGNIISTRGICWSTSSTPTNKNYISLSTSATSTYSCSLTNLNPNTTYYTRSFITCGISIAYGNILSFKTASSVTVKTTAVTNADENGNATTGGTVTANGNTITAVGICWDITTNPTIYDDKIEYGPKSGQFTSTIKGLDSYTTYYVRAYAKTSSEIIYGNNVSFKTPEWVEDWDGIRYKVLTIGTQKWLGRNLTSFSDKNGGVIEDYNLIRIDSKNFHYFLDGYTRDLCMMGWHIPTVSDWTKLANYLGGASVAGGKLKEAGFSNWNSPNTGASNSSGFTALPYGIGDWGEEIGQSAYFWAKSSLSAVQLKYNSAELIFIDYPQMSLSIRCIKD